MGKWYRARVAYDIGGDYKILELAVPLAAKPLYFKILKERYERDR